MPSDEISLETYARVLAQTQPNVSAAMTIARARVPASIVRFGVAPMWSLGATAEAMNENGKKRFQIDVNLGSWLVLRQKLADPSRTGIRHLPDGRIARFSVDEKGIACITCIEDGKDEITRFISEQVSDIRRNKVNADVEICILFILFHELAHCIFEHDPPGRAPPLADCSRSIEFQADAFALKQLIVALRIKAVRTILKLDDHRDCNLLIATGRSVAIVIGALCEQECFRYRHTTHPPAGDRISFLTGATAFLDFGFTEYERTGLIAGLMEGIKFWPSWYSRTEFETDKVESSTDKKNGVRVHFFARATR